MTWREFLLAHRLTSAPDVAGCLARDALGRGHWARPGGEPLRREPHRLFPPRWPVNRKKAGPGTGTQAPDGSCTWFPFPLSRKLWSS